MQRIILTMSLGLIVLFTSCGGTRSANTTSGRTPQLSTSSNASGDTGGGGGGGVETAKPDLVADSTRGVLAEKVSLTQAQLSHTNPAPVERKIVRNADISLESEKPEESQKRIATIVESKGGFVVESQQSSSDVKVNARDIVQMTVRVPADKFAEALDEIRATSSRVIVETVKGEDVTEEFIDIEARLTAKKALEQQFMEIMKRANTVEDALSVQSQLADVRSEIEKIEGRKRFLENQASLSTIKIRLQTPAVFSANSSGFFYRLTESFANGFDIAIGFILGLVTFVVAALPFAVFIGLPAYLIGRAVIRRRNRPMSVTDIVADEVKDE